jgi:DNA repair exonuclease SbcCD ATPase subunit
MKFTAVKATNFLRFKEVIINLENRGLVLVRGENRDADKKSSNGAGKSSILEAICWGLWGSTIRGLSGDEVVNTTVGRDCAVEVTFEEGGSVYRVVRSQKRAEGKPNDLDFFKDNQDISLRHVADTQRLINEAMNLDMLTFQCMMPGAGIKVAELTDAKVKAVLEQLLQMEEIAKAQELAKEKRNQLTTELASLDKDISFVANDIQRIEDRLADFRKKSEGFQLTQNAKLFRLDGRRESLLKDLEEVKQKLAQEELEAQDPDQLKKDLDQKQQELRTLKSNYSDVLASANLAASDLEALVVQQNTLLREKESQLAEFWEIGPKCQHCFQDVPEAHASSVKADLEEQRANYDSLVKASSRKLLEATENRNDIKVSFTNKIDALKREIEAIVKEFAKHRQRVSDVAHTRQILDQKTEALSQVEEDILLVKEEENVYDSLCDSLVQEAVDKASKQASLMKEHKKLQADLDKYLFWVEGFSNKGLRSYLLKSIVPVLNEFADHYCELLTENDMTIQFHTQRTLKSGKSKEEFNIEVSQRDGHTTYKGSSSGERARADLVIALALGDLAKLRSNKSVSFRFLDEPFESVDDAGIAPIISLLQQQEAQYDTVFCVSHRENIQAQFSETLTVVKENEFASIKE